MAPVMRRAFFTQCSVTVEVIDLGKNSRYSKKIVQDEGGFWQVISGKGGLRNASTRRGTGQTGAPVFSVVWG